MVLAIGKERSESLDWDEANGWRRMGSVASGFVGKVGGTLQAVAVKLLVLFVLSLSLSSIPVQSIMRSL